LLFFFNFFREPEGDFFFGFSFGRDSRVFYFILSCYELVFLCGSTIIIVLRFLVFFLSGTILSGVSLWISLSSFVGVSATDSEIDFVLVGELITTAVDESISLEVSLMIWSGT